MKAIENETRWAKIGRISSVSFIGREVIFYGSGCHLVFCNLNTEEETVYTANSWANGDGISCYVGHRSQNIFAFAEKKNDPSVFVKSYPEFENIICLKGGDKRGFIGLVFSESSLLISLGDLPNFKITVWNWRHGEKIATRDGSIIMHKQILKCSFGSPVFMAQLGLDSQNLRVWDIYMCGQKCILTEHIIKISEKSDQFTGVLWNSEGSLFVLDQGGCVYMQFSENLLEKVIDCTEEGTHPTSLVWFKQGIVVAGPNNQIRHYKKSGEWEIDWTLTPPEEIFRLESRFDSLIAVTVHSNILIVQNQNTFKFLKKDQNQFNDFCLIYPTGLFILALSHNRKIHAYKVQTGERLHTLEIKGKPTIIVENPKFPYAALGLENGVVKLISAFQPSKLTKMTEFFLVKRPINSIRFNECGTIFVASDLRTGIFFIIEGLPGGEMNVVSVVDSQRQVVDTIMVASNDCYRIFTIPVTSPDFPTGNVVIRYCVTEERGIDEREYSFKNHNFSFSRIVASLGPNRHRLFYLLTKEGKSFKEVEIKKGDNTATITNTFVTGHQIGNVALFLNEDFVVTWGYDGLVIAKTQDFYEDIGVVLPHHRMNAGVQKACLDPYQKHIISLGRDGVLTCTELKEQVFYEYMQTDLECSHNSEANTMLFSRHTIGFQPKGKYEGKCYLEYQELKRTEKERMESEKERQSIFHDFKVIRKELKSLLTKNIEGPDNEKLDLEEFNLNVKQYQEKCTWHKKLREATEIYLKELIKERDRISEFMMQNFWERMKVHGAAIKALFENFDVTNYVLIPTKPDLKNQLIWIRHLRQIETFLNEESAFHPWEPMPEEKLLKMVATKPYSINKRVDNSKYDLTEVETEENQEDLETKIAFTGSDLARFIELEHTHYHQNEIQTYIQTDCQWIISKTDIYKVKLLFNEQFDKTMMQKQKEMSNLLQKNGRLRHIVSELNYFSEDKFSVRIDDPEWQQVENPELLTVVKTEEVPISPYISPSEQAILDAKAAEAERIRLLLLADDFRERALMAMMNGVLEVRWEDELKKDVPLPKCMIEKEPENYNEDDLRAVKDYEEKVQFLNSERERYKSLLRSEYQKVADSVRESIRKFNGKLKDLYVLKLEMDAAVSHETLKIHRLKLFQFRRKTLTKKEQILLDDLNENEEIILSLNKVMHTLHEAIHECKGYVDSFQAKDKFLERNFKKDFQDLSVVVQEQVVKLYKKRPKINYRGITSANMLNELSKYVLAPRENYPVTITSDCVEFLRQLENLDNYVGIPPVVDEHIYALLCRHRRIRIEYEIKLRAAQNSLAEAEATLAAFHKRLHEKKQLTGKLQQELDSTRNKLLQVIINSDVQIVLPRGLVEVPLSGSVDDFKESILVRRDDVEKINNIIMKFGLRKIRALERDMRAHRKILLMEWEHKRYKMLIQDLNEKLVDIENVKLTKEIQTYLKAKDKEKSIPFETEVDMIKASYENTIEDMKEKVRKMRKQITALKNQDQVTSERIKELNIDVCEMNMLKDSEVDEKERRIIDIRMKSLLQRSKLIQQIQDNHHEILMLQTELELLRLKTFPTLKYKVM